MEDKKEFIEGLNTYYKLKNAYEEKLSKEKHKIIVKDNLSWKEKRREYKSIKPKCINCNRVGGTIFSNKFNEDTYGKTLTAVCGNHENQCPLNIVIHLGNIVRSDDLLEDDEKKISDYKTQIVKDKNDLIFGYIKTEEAINRFDKIKTKLNETISFYEMILESYLNIIDNKEKEDESKRLKVGIYNNIQSIKTYIEEYDKTENTKFVSDAVDLYINELNPKVTSLRNTIYAVNYVDYDFDDNTYHLIQKKFNIDEIENNLSDKWGVEKLQVGISTNVSKPANKTNKTNKTKPKTKLLIVDEASASESESDSEVESEPEEEEEEEDL